MRPATPLALAALLAACASGPRSPRPVAPRPPAPSCLFRGRWAFGEIRGARSGVPFANVTRAAARGALVREPAGPALRLLLRVRGWSLLGTADLAHGHALRPQRLIALDDVVTAHVGADVSVRDARPGEALIAPGRFTFGAEEGVRFVADPARWVPCAALGFDFTFRDEHTEERERAAMGLGPDLPTREIPAGASVDLAATPGGAPRVRVAPRGYGLTVRPLATQGAFTRVLLQHWTSFAVVAWLPTDALSDDQPGGNGGLMGGIGSLGRRPLTVCRAPVDLPFGFARAREALEYAGAVSAGTEFIRGASTPDGGFEIAPYPRGASPHHVAGVTWVAHALAPLTCRAVVE